MTDTLAVFHLALGVAFGASMMYTIKRNRDSQGKFIGLIVVILAIGILIIVSAYNGVLPMWDKDSWVCAASSDNNDSPILSAIQPSQPEVGVEAPTTERIFHGIMIDAGSTGSRIHVFKFRETKPGKPYEFVDELFVKIQPGLSSYAEDPKAAADSLRDMLKQAEEYVPRDQWESTPIALKATAGMRLLPENEANAIIDEVKKLLASTPFREEADSVAIMEGTDEGVFSWFTVNFFAGSLGNIDLMQGVMDLGGGSTQITFTPKDEDTIRSAPEDYLHDIDIFGKTHKLYTHSYLGLGLMSGRLRTMGGKEGSDANPETLTSPCFPENYEGKMEFGNDEYQVKGMQPASGSRFDACYAAAKLVIQSESLHSTPEIHSKSFTIISYYYDKAVAAGLIPADSDGGAVTVEDFIKASSRVCQDAAPAEPFLCLDLSFISALLHEGFGVARETTLSVHKKLNGNEISWGLGAMFDFYNTHQHTR